MNPKIITPKEKSIVLKNFTSLTTLQGINYLLPIVILPYLIRIIGPEKFGLIAFAQAFIQYFMILTDYSFSLSATRKIALCKQNKKQTCAIFSSVMTIKIILALISFVLLLIIINFVPRFKNDWLVYVLSFGAVIGNTLFPVWFFQGKEKMSHIASVNIIGGIIYAVCILLFVRRPQDYILVPIFNSLFFLITGVSGLYIAFRKFELAFAFQSYEDIQKELKSGWNIFISIVAINAYTATRIFAVGLFTNNIITGYYSIAERIANFIQMFPLLSLSQALYPRLNKIFLKNKKRAIILRDKIQKSTTAGFLITLPIIFLISPWIVNIICGTAYPEVILILRILLLAVFCVGANAFRVQFFLICDKTDIYSRLHVTAALLGLPLILLLIYYFSYVGAATSTVIIELGIFTATSLMLSKLTCKLKNNHP